jgi:hypothetical protein
LGANTNSVLTQPPERRRQEFDALDFGVVLRREADFVGLLVGRL